MNTVQKKASGLDASFFMGVVSGGLIALMVLTVFWWEVLRPRYMSAIEDFGKMAVEIVGKCEKKEVINSKKESLFNE